MSDPIVILTEEPLGAYDRVNRERLVDGQDTPLVLLVPGNTERHLLVDFLENLSLLDVAKAFRELTAHAPDPSPLPRDPFSPSPASRPPLLLTPRTPHPARRIPAAEPSRTAISTNPLEPISATSAPTATSL